MRSSSLQKHYFMFVVMVTCCLAPIYYTMTHYSHLYSIPSPASHYSSHNASESTSRPHFFQRVGQRLSETVENWLSAGTRVFGFENETTTTFEGITAVIVINSSVVVNVSFNLPDLSNPQLKQFMAKYDRKFDNRYLGRKGNANGITFRGIRRSRNFLSGTDLLCEFKGRVPFDVIVNTTSPFKDIGLGDYLPTVNLNEKYGNRLNSCAVVSSSAFMNKSKLGREIDSHDAVLRFNTAPVIGYESDVGKKTTFRLLNSQVLEGDLFQNDTTDSIFHDGTLLIWRAGPYNGNLYRYYNDKTGKRYFYNYIKRSLKHPNSNIYLVNPNPLWKAWDVVQENIPKSLKKTPVSSGFVGIMAMLQLCNTVDVYGYVTPLTKNACHYYDSLPRITDKKGRVHCSSATWHPINEERLMTRAMHIGTEADIKNHGKVTLRGFRNVTCTGRVKRPPARAPVRPRRRVVRKPRAPPRRH
ncbi:beta-galactoside alpha-2,6-sialyltransferase 1-like [Ptychodera flava]|uniref:beta-galactoside alpha-2,6-sialyltransferase 1-like n=1 Tax=Ptychodera flava TaxID=63121 RepID=UPI00396A6A08